MFNKANAQRLVMVISLALGILLLALAVSMPGLRLPVGAQDPPPQEMQSPAMMAMEPRPMADAELPVRVSVNYADDILEEGYPAGNTIWITVTNASTVVKATIELVSGDIPWWPAGQRGFSSELGTWVPSRPDIVPGDWVHVSTSLGHTASVKVGDIRANINPATNIITGTIDAPWILPDDVEVKCKAFNPETGAFSQVFDEAANRSTYTDGVDVFTCNFSSRWNLQPGHLVAISYDPLEPDIRSNRILNVFPVPGPYLQIRKWVGGAPGIFGSTPGNLVFNVEYRNTGTTNATNVTITDLMDGLIFVGDTSGLPRSGSGAGPITWQVGTVPPGAKVQFQVFASINAAVGATVSNAIEIVSNPAANMGMNNERRATWSGVVQSNAAWLSVNKNAWTPNPLPGSEFIQVTEVCNTDYRYAVDSTTATLTEDLPPELTLVDWWSQHGGWTQTARSSAQLVLTRPSIAAGGCTQVYMRLRVSATAVPGDALCVNAGIQAANNTTTTPTQIAFCRTVGVPEANLTVDKRWAGGILRPGGEIAYEVEVRNTGNVEVSGPILLTDVMPTGTTFVRAVLDPDSPVSFSLSPTQQTGSQVSWNLPTLEPGYWAKFTVSLKLNAGIPVGTALINTVNVEKTGLVEDMSDNTATWEETVQGPGPNLRVIKVGEWANRGLRTDRINYRLAVENVGDIGVYDVVVTDTYDTRMRIAGPVRIDAWQRTFPTYNTDARAFYVGTGYLAPGARFNIDFATFVETRPVAPGLIFTNTATITAHHLDTSTADNTTTVMNVSGPDLEVVKAHTAGEPHPGELVTFLLTYRNAHPAIDWWWGLQGNALLTDTLPDGLEFVSAERWRCGATTWCSAPPDSVQGQQLTWNLGPLQAGEWNMLRVVARISSTVGQQQLVNRASIASSNSSADAEADTSNNSATATLNVTVPFEGVHTLNVVTVGQGTVGVNPNQPSYGEGQQVTLTATPATGWVFAGWSGGASGNANPLVLTMTGDVTVVATFTSIPYSLDVTINGQGTVTKTPDQDTYAYGDEVLLTATPATGWLFTTWGGDASGTQAQTLVTIDGNKAVDATFVETTLAITKAVDRDAGVKPGDVVSYTITLANTGSGQLSGIAMTDILPAGVLFGGFTAVTNLTPAPTVAGNTITWNGNLPAGGPPATLTFTATLSTDAFPYGRTVTNRVEALLATNGTGTAAAEASFTTVPLVIYLPLVMQQATR